MARIILPQNVNRADLEMQQLHHPAAKSANGSKRMRPRSLLQLLSGLDQSSAQISQAEINATIGQISAQFSEISSDFLIGILSHCHLGTPYDVHFIDFAGSILRHVTQSETLDSKLEAARPLALHPAYEYVEVYESKICCIRSDGSVSEISNKN